MSNAREQYHFQGQPQCSGPSERAHLIRGTIPDQMLGVSEVAAALANRHIGKEVRGRFREIRSCFEASRG